MDKITVSVEVENVGNSDADRHLRHALLSAIVDQATEQFYGAGKGERFTYVQQVAVPKDDA